MKIFTTSFLANNLYGQSVEDKWVLFRDTVVNIVGKKHSGEADQLTLASGGSEHA